MNVKNFFVKTLSKKEPLLTAPEAVTIVTPLSADYLDIKSSLKIPAPNTIKAEGWLGQPKTFEELELMLKIKSDRFGIALIGPDGTTRTRTLRHILKRHKKPTEPLKDLVALFNAEQPENPLLLWIPNGYGRKLSANIEKAVETVKKEMRAYVNEKAYPLFKKLEKEYWKKKKECTVDLEEEVYKNGLFLIPRNVAPPAPGAPKFYSESQERVLYYADATKHVKEVRSLNMDPLGDLYIGALTKDNKTGKDFYIFADQVDRCAEQKIISETEAETIAEKLEPAIKRANQTVQDLVAKETEGKKEIENQLQKEFVEKTMQAAKTLVQQMIFTPHISSYVKEKLQWYVEKIEEEIISNLEMISETPLQQIPQDTSFGKIIPGPDPRQEMLKTEFMRRFGVNIIVDNANQEERPVIFQRDIDWKELFGYIVRRQVSGTGMYTSDHMDFRGGKLLEANGGIFVFYIRDVARTFRTYEGNPGVWAKILEVLVEQKVRITNTDPFGLAPIQTKCEKIPVKIKPIIILTYSEYDVLWQFEDFRKAFKTRVEFEASEKLTDESIENLYSCAKTISKDEELAEVDQDGMKELTWFGCRLVGRRDEVSLDYASLADIIREANASALSDVISKREIAKVIERRTTSLTRKKILETRIENTVTIHTDGRLLVGELTALALVNIGDIRFGVPFRTTVNAEPGNGKIEITDLESNAGLSGEIYKKAIGIVLSILKEKFSEDFIPTVNLSFGFEQSYSQVDGDSASLETLCVLISKLSGIAIPQMFAVTGRVSLKGEVGPVGGVSEKIEGYFYVCKERGLNGQGVILSKTNIRDLVLKDEVVDAVREGKFFIYPVETVEEAVEILMQMKAGTRKEKTAPFITGSKTEWEKNSVYWHVDQKLKKFKQLLQK